jgi:RNA polymerase sigma-70 factor (family 1)
LKNKPLNNSDLIRLLSEGNEDAFRLVYDSYYRSLCHYANRILNDFDDSEDIVQNIIMKLWENGESLNGISDLKSYLFRSVHNGCLNKISRISSKEKYQSESWLNLKAIEMEYRDSLQYIELDEIINKLIHELPEQCQRVFRMSRFDDKSYKEIALELNVTVKAVEANISRALQKMRLGLKDYLYLIILLYLK